MMQYILWLASLLVFQNLACSTKSIHVSAPDGTASPAEGTDGVVVFMATDVHYIERMNKNLVIQRIYRAWLEKRRHPIIIFAMQFGPPKYSTSKYVVRAPFPGGEKTFEPLLRQVPEGYPISVEWFNVSYPKVIKAMGPQWIYKRNQCSRRRRGGTAYYHMNQFFTLGMYTHPALRKYRYYARVDSDDYFRKRLSFDPFSVMARDGLSFMCPRETPIEQAKMQHIVESCSEGLFDFVEEYRKRHQIQARSGKWGQDRATTSYDGCLGFGDLAFFRSPEYLELARSLNEDGRVYLNRWSDQNIYVLALDLFKEASAVRIEPKLIPSFSHKKVEPWTGRGPLLKHSNGTGGYRTIVPILKEQEVWVLDEQDRTVGKYSSEKDAYDFLGSRNIKVELRMDFDQLPMTDHSRVSRRPNAPPKRLAAPATAPRTATTPRTTKAAVSRVKGPATPAQLARLEARQAARAQAAQAQARADAQG